MVMQSSLCPGGGEGMNGETPVLDLDIPGDGGLEDGDSFVSIRLWCFSRTGRPSPAVGGPDSC
jgi:hypothetical protein